MKPLDFTRHHVCEDCKAAFTTMGHARWCDKCRPARMKLKNVRTGNRSHARERAVYQQLGITRQEYRNRKRREQRDV